jgi:hypothetical protein
MAESRTDQRWREEPSDRSLRASDDDRERVAELLRAEHLAGRIDDAELEERLERCLAARTYADLDQLVADLPRPERPRAASARRQHWAPPRLAFLLVPLFLVAVVFSHGHALWLLFPLAFFLFVRSAIFGGRRGCFGAR